ncbi:MAG: choice-of-anchor Q domain-containing protein [bacterium]
MCRSFGSIRRVMGGLAMAGVACATGASAATFQVDRTDDVLTATACTNAPNDCSLRGAVERANAGTDMDLVLLPAGTYVLTLPPPASGNGNAGGSIDAFYATEIRGDGADTTIIDGNGIDRVLSMGILTGSTRYTEILSGVTLTGGHSSSAGGGLVNAGTLTLTDSKILGNFSESGGGGLHAQGGDGVIERVVISGNTGRHGGGLVWFPSLTLRDSTVADNVATGHPSSRGGGLLVGDDFPVSTVLIERSTISGNQTPGPGGGIEFQIGGNFTLSNSTVTGNHAGADGGGISHTAGTLTIVHSTIASNTAVTGATAIRQVQVNGPPTTILRNDLLTGSCVHGGSWSSDGGNVESPGDTCGFALDTDRHGVSSVALALGALAQNGGRTSTHVPGLTSVAVGAAVAANCLASDQRETTRPQGAACDAGAVEVVLDEIFADDFQLGDACSWTGSSPAVACD